MNKDDNLPSQDPSDDTAAAADGVAADGVAADGVAADDVATDGAAADGAAADGEAADAAETPGAAAGSRELADALRQRDEFKDLLLRKTAEFENYRKRIDRERQQVSENAAAGVIEELLPIVDDLERALKVETGPQGADAYRRGVELIQRQMDDILRKRGVRPLEALGAHFDPHYHQAVSHEPAEGRREGEVIEEFRRGYLLGDRLLRPSMVKVAKG